MGVSDTLSQKNNGLTAFALAAAVFTGSFWAGWQLSSWHDVEKTPHAAVPTDKTKAVAGAEEEKEKDAKALPQEDSTARSPGPRAPEDERSRNARVIEGLKQALQEAQAIKIPTDSAQCSDKLKKHPFDVALPLAKAEGLLPEGLSETHLLRLPGGKSTGQGMGMGADLVGLAAFPEDLDPATTFRIQAVDLYGKVRSAVTGNFARLDNCARQVAPTEPASSDIKNEVGNMADQFVRLNRAARLVGLPRFDGKTLEALQLYEDNVVNRTVHIVFKNVAGQACNDLLRNAFAPFDTYQENAVLYFWHAPVSPYTTPTLNSSIRTLQEHGICPGNLAVATGPAL